jgi:hypothetical protein
MKRLALLASLVAGCADHGFALDLDVERGCLAPTSLAVTVTVEASPPRAPVMQTIDGAGFFAGLHHLVVLAPDGAVQLEVDVAAFDGLRQIAAGSVIVPIDHPALVERTLTLDTGCMGDASVGDLGGADGFNADLAPDLAYTPSCPGAKCVFTASTAFGANFGGLAGADMQCQMLAQAAGLNGEYRAWLSSTTESAGSRLSHAAVPYHLVDGTLIANDWSDLTSGSLRHAIDLNEHGGAPPGTSAVGGHDVWTDTLPSGALNFPSSTCGDWANPGAPGSLGDYTQQTGMYWTYKFNLSACSGTATLYCLEQ